MHNSGPCYANNITLEIKQKSPCSIPGLCTNQYKSGLQLTLDYLRMH